tara:strand:- start:13520 stop:14071 length:552 start_codon:yes stop_codon:yes gene_type:complete
MIEKYIEAFEEIKDTEIKSNYDLQTWKAKAINIAIRLYGEDSKQEEQINLIKYKTYMSGSINGSSFGGGNNAKNCEKRIQEVTSGFISDLNRFGLPEKVNKNKEGGINISVNQNQTVSVNIIVEAIKDELTGNQVKEIEKILNSKEDETTKKQKVADKIKKFGSDVAANILSNILTNPAIYGG